MNVSNFVRCVRKKEKISFEIRLYLIDEKKHYFISDGALKNGFATKLTIQNNRDSVLSAFSKMAFLFDEIIRLRIVQHSNQSNSDELLYLLNLVPVNRKIRTFLDWGVFEPEFTRDMSRLFEVRNDIVHCISLDDVTYNHPTNKISLSSSSGFKKFKRDFENNWKILSAKYLQEQEKTDLKKILDLL